MQLLIIITEKFGLTTAVFLEIRSLQQGAFQNHQSGTRLAPLLWVSYNREKSPLIIGAHMEQYKQDFIEFMVESGALLFGDFTTKSGRKTPFFINAGNFNTGKQLDRLGFFYAQAIWARFGSDFDVLFGPAYKGIPLSVAASMAFSRLYDADIAYCSNRKEIKDHGDAGIMMGHKLKDGDRVLIIEDVTTAGTSIAETMPILKGRARVDVLGLIIAVDRMERGQGTQTALAELRDLHGFATGAIVTMGEVVAYLYKREVNGRILIDEAMNKRIEEYYRQYGATE